MGSRTWRELSGETNWEGMLNPLDNDLRMYIIRYGIRAQAIVDAFNHENHSPACNFSRFPKEGFFPNVRLEKSSPNKYEVEQFVYCKNIMNKGETTWIGYVAVVKNDEAVQAVGRRDILVSWRGPVWLNEDHPESHDEQQLANDIFPWDDETKIHMGWRLMYTGIDQVDEYTNTSARSQVLEKIKLLIQKYSNEDISITVIGHGMGGALATLNGADIVVNWKNNFPGTHLCPVTVFAFSSPMVGNESFQEKVEGLENLHILRIENVRDKIPHLPPGNYYPVGKTVQVDSRDSPYLKYIQDGASKADDLGEVHQLEPLLHLVAGTNGIGNSFNLNNRRQVVLVNKDGDNIKEDVVKEYPAPASWWVVENKGMVQNEDGTWELKDYKPPP